MAHAQKPSPLRLFYGAIALALSLTLLSTAVQAGRSYWYCTSMHHSMLHACCSRAGGNTAPNRAGQPHDAIASECCVARNVAALKVFTPLSRADHGAAREVGLKPFTAPQLAAQSIAPRDPVWNLPRRAGPPGLRVHARLMVFLI